MNDLPITSVRPNPDQPRRDFDPAALDELAASIRQYGILEPLTAVLDTHFDQAERADVARIGAAFIREIDLECTPDFPEAGPQELAQIADAVWHRRVDRIERYQSNG